MTLQAQRTQDKVDEAQQRAALIAATETYERGEQARALRRNSFMARDYGKAKARNPDAERPNFHKPDTAIDYINRYKDWHNNPANKIAG